MYKPKVYITYREKSRKECEVITIEIHEILELYGEDIKNGEIDATLGGELFNYLLMLAESDVTSVRRLLSRLYQYLLKYRFQKEKQSVIWVEVIRNVQVDLWLILETKYLREKIDLEIQQRTYQIIREYLIRTENLPPEVLEEELPEDFLLENLLDYGNIWNYLNKYAYDPLVKKELGITDEAV